MPPWDHDKWATYPSRDMPRKRVTSAKRPSCRFPELLTGCPGNIHDSDLDVLANCFNQRQIIEVVTAIATTNWNQSC